MDIVDRQQFLGASGEPIFASAGLALWAMSGPARVEGGGLIAALAAAIQMAPERCRAAMFDGEEHAEVQPGQPRTVPVDTAVAVLTNDVGHLERRLRHFLYSLRERFT